MPFDFEKATAVLAKIRAVLDMLGCQTPPIYGDWYYFVSAAKAAENATTYLLNTYPNPNETLQINAFGSVVSTSRTLAVALCTYMAARTFAKFGYDLIGLVKTLAQYTAPEQYDSCYDLETTLSISASENLLTYAQFLFDSAQYQATHEVLLSVRAIRGEDFPAYTALLEKVTSALVPDSC